MRKKQNSPPKINDKFRFFNNQKHPIVKDLIQSVFVGHPKACRVSFMPIKDHIILKGIDVFTFPENDEHYMMNMVVPTNVEIIAKT